MTNEEIKEISKKQFDYFADELQQVDTYEPETSYYFQKQWQGFEQAPKDLTIWDTGMSWDLLGFIGRASVHYPPEFVSKIAQKKSINSH